MSYRSDRDSRYGSVEIEKGDFFVLHGDEVLAVDASLIQALGRSLGELDLSDAGCVSLYYNDAFDQRCMAELERYIMDLHQHLSVEFHYGGQPGSQLIVAVE